MRYLGYALLGLLIFLSGYWLYQSKAESLLNSVPFDIPEHIDLQQSQLYLFQQGKPLSFLVSQLPEKIWISSLAGLNDISSSSGYHSYSILMTLEDRDGKQVFENELTFSSFVAERHTVEQVSEKVPEFFVSDKTIALTVPKSIHFSVRDLQPRKITFEVVSMSEQMSRLGLRVYQKVRRSSRLKPIESWERLSLKQKRLLTENYPFQLSDLTTAEKENLATFRWQPLVPEGNAPEDYQITSLFQLPKEAYESSETILNSFEHIADEHRWVTFPIHEKGQYKLSVEHTFTKRPFDIKWIWHSPFGRNTKDKTVQLKGRSADLTLNLEPGLLEVSASLPVSLLLNGIDAEHHEHYHLATRFLLKPKQEIAYRIYHSDNKGTPLKLSFARYGDVSAPITGSDGLHLTWLDDDGKVLDTQELKAPEEPDNYRMASGSEMFHYLGLQQDKYFIINPLASRLKVTSDTSHLITLSTRPESVAVTRFYPQQQPDWFDFDESVPDWFQVNPENYVDFINQGLIVPVRYYHQPIEFSPELDPETETVSSFLLSDTGVLRQEVMQPITRFIGQPKQYSSYYTQIKEKRFLLSEEHKETGSLSLFFTKDDAKPRKQNIIFDNGHTESFWMPGQWGLVTFLVPPSASSFTLDGEGSDFFVDKVSTANPSFIKKQARTLESGRQITTVIPKSDFERNASITVYPTSPKPITLLIGSDHKTIKTGVPMDRYVPGSRRYVLTPELQPELFRLHSQERLYKPFRISIPLPMAQKGDTDITIALTDGDRVYINGSAREVLVPPNIERFKVSTESEGEAQ